MRKKMQTKLALLLAALLLAAAMGGCALMEKEEPKTDLDKDRETFNHNLSLRVVEEVDGLTPRNVQQLEGNVLVSVDYPEVGFRESVTNDYVVFINHILETFQKETGAMGAPTEQTGLFTLIVTYKPYLVGNGVLGMKFTESSYTGKTDKQTYVTTFVHDMTTGEQWGLDDVFDTSTDYLTAISHTVRNHLLRNEIIRGDLREDLFELGTAPSIANFSNFVLTPDNKIIFFFNRNTIAPGDAGMIEACIPLSDFEGYLNEDNRELIFGATVALPTDEELQPDEGREAEGSDTDIAWLKKDGEFMQPFSIEGIDIENDKVIAITFDDGPGQYTPELLDTLKAYDAKATFFMVGEMAENYKDTIKRIYDEGHEIANHSWDHQYMTKISFEAARDEQYGRTSALIQEVTGKKPLFCRPPGGLMTEELAEQLDMGQIMWSNDTRDWEHKNDPDGVSVIYNNIMNDTGDGTIILLHDIHSNSVQAAIRAIPDLVDKGYKFVTVSQMMQIAAARGYEINYMTDHTAYSMMNAPGPQPTPTDGGDDGGDTE